MPQEIVLRIAPENIENNRFITDEIARKLQLNPNQISVYQVVKRSIDARGRNIQFQLKLKVFVEEPFEDIFTFEHRLRSVANMPEVLIAGAGPAGLFAALQLIENGFCPVILERGKDVRSRRRNLAAMNKQGIVNPESNYCFGEGGAGTYSDGKLYTRSNKRGDVIRCLQWLRYFGAPEQILQDAHPHIGTNKLPAIITAIREAIEHCGGKILFQHKITDILLENNRLKGVEVNHQEVIQNDNLILATGHSARDIFHLLHRRKVQIESKPFALGLRVEHPQVLVDAVQYHCNIHQVRPDFLPPASYSLVSQEQGRGVFSFCMCPGGIIAPASTEEGFLVVNGWSPSKRDNPYANSGIVATVNEQDFHQYGFSGDLAALQFQQMVEAKAWEAGGGKLVAPAQRLEDFIQNKTSASLPKASYLPGIDSALLSEVLPKEIYQSLALAFQSFGKKMKGYRTNEAIVVATESRTSSPVKIPRDSDTLQHPQIKGLFPCGEGAGYAGGIISAAMDGMKVANALAVVLKK